GRYRGPRRHDGCGRRAPAGRRQGHGLGLPKLAARLRNRPWSARLAADTRSSDTLTFLATYNERANIDHMLDAILALPERCDVLVVADNSSDGPGAGLAGRAAAEPRLHVVSRGGLLGIGSAHRLGWLYARHHGYARIVTLDADLSHDPLD